MANKRTSEEVSATDLTGVELFRISQNGVSKKATAAQIATYTGGGSGGGATGPTGPTGADSTVPGPTGPAGLVTKGTTTLDFGAGADQAKTTVATSAVAPDNVIILTVNSAGTIDHGVDDHLIEPFDLRPANIIPGVSFDIIMKPRGNFNLQNTWSVKWAIA